MRKDEIAESILSLFTSAERAGAATGDLMEDPRSRGFLWFWGGVMKTVSSRLWHDLTDTPAFLTGLAFRGNLYSLWLTLLWNMALLAVVIVVALAWNQIRGLIEPGPSWISSESVAQVFTQALGLAAVGMAQFRTGCWLARRARGREIAGCIAYLLVGIVLWSVVTLCLGPVLERFATNFIPKAGYGSISIGFMAMTTAVSYAALYAGAIGVRRESVRGAAI
jgi:hypothetical protein